MKTTLYKKDCEPYIVTTKEALEFHLNQGWVEDEADIEPVEAVIPLTKPYNVLDGDVPPSLVDASVKSLQEALAAKDQEIADLTSDFEEVIAGLNATIAKLKGDEVPTDAADFGLPPVEGPTNQQLRDQLDAAGIKHTPRDNKTALLALVEKIPKEV
jgi:hypothetical protein